MNEFISLNKECRIEERSSKKIPYHALMILEDIKNRVQNILLFTDVKSLEKRLKVTIQSMSSINDYTHFMEDWLKMCRDMDITITGKDIPKIGETIPVNGTPTSKIKVFHDNLAAQYKIRMNEIMLKNFKKVSARAKALGEVEIDDYFFKVPNDPIDVSEEGRMQGNCVASYSNTMANDNCVLVFMRHKDNLDQSLLTIEVDRDMIKIKQVEGKSRRRPYDAENRAIDKWFDHIKKRKIELEEEQKKLKADAVQAKK